MENRYAFPKTSLISFMSNKVKTGGGVNFAQGIPGFAPPKALMKALALNAENPAVQQYAHGQGAQPLIDWIANKYCSTHTIKRNHIRITDGATEAIWVIYTYLNSILPNDYAALAFDPVYESYLHLPAIYGKRFVRHQIPQNLSINFEQLEQQFISERVRILFLNSPGNPLGKVWSKEEVKQLHALCKKHDVYIIADCVYNEFSFSDESAYTPVDLIDEHLFYCNSFSKSLSITGWRVGYYIAAPVHLEKLWYIHDYTALSSPSVAQAALADYLTQQDGGKAYIATIKAQLTKNALFVESTLQQNGFTVYKGGGGYFVWAALPEAFTDGFRFAIDLYEEEKVAVIPGIHFSEHGKRFIRLNIAWPKAQVEEGLKRIMRFIQHHQQV